MKDINENIEYCQHSITADVLLAMLSDHMHHYVEMFVCGKGSIQINTTDEIITLHAGEAAIIPPDIHHRCLK